jgi:hypothetical protein
MRISSPIFLSLALAPFFLAPGAVAQTCSTEKVNHENCHLPIDRRYPLSLPTIQMSPGKIVTVDVYYPFEFETLSLDAATTSALPGTDQLASFATAAFPNFKGLVTSTITIPNPEEIRPLAARAFDGGDPDSAQMRIINAELGALRSMLTAADAADPDDQHDRNNTKLLLHIQAIYEQINQALATVPKPGSGAGGEFHPPDDAPHTPNPWTNYGDWRNCLLDELVGSPDNANCVTSHPAPPAPVPPDFTNVLGRIATVEGRLPATPPSPAPADPLFDQAAFDALAKHVKSDIDKLELPQNKTAETEALRKLKEAEASVLAKIAALASTLTNVQKDFLSYYQNIFLATHALPERAVKDGAPLSYSTVQTIGDPGSPGLANLHAPYLGKSVTWSLNAVNNISTARSSTTTAAAKVSIATVTVLYADPRLETSAGAIVSFVHNRTFSNQTITAPPAGSSLASGDIVIAQTKTDPEVVPFVAAHWRLGNDFVIGHRRGAIYGTGWVGLNPYSTLPEYGAGPTLSWRSLMVSVLYNRAHQTALISGESVGEVVCSPTASAGATPPPCSPAPPSPITKTNGINAFAIGLSVRIPTSFAAGTGGVSR